MRHYNDNRLLQEDLVKTRVSNPELYQAEDNIGPDNFETARVLYQNTASVEKLQQDTEAFKVQLDEYLNDPQKWSRRKPLIVGSTPLALEYGGVKIQSLETMPSTIDKVLNIGKGGKHDVQESVFRDLLYHISDPLWTCLQKVDSTRLFRLPYFQTSLD